MGGRAKANVITNLKKMLGERVICVLCHAWRSKSSLDFHFDSQALLLTFTTEHSE